MEENRVAMYNRTAELPEKIGNVISNVRSSQSSRDENADLQRNLDKYMGWPKPKNIVIKERMKNCMVEGT